MVVSVLQLLVEFPDVVSLKEKRRILSSAKDRIRRKYKLSIAETDYQDAWGTAEIGCAVVSNSRIHGESVMQKVIHFAEDTIPGRIRDARVFSEIY